MLKTTLASLALLGSMAAPVASAIEFHFNLDFGGTKFPGIIETTPGGGLKTPGNGELIRLEVTVFGETFTDFDDVDYDDFPEVEISADGSRLVAIDFVAENFNGALLEIDFREGFSNEATYEDASTYEEGIVDVPDTGSTAALLPLGLGGLIWLTRRNARGTLPRP
jgi:hypothetical protein